MGLVLVTHIISTEHQRSECKAWSFPITAYVHTDKSRSACIELPHKIFEGKREKVSSTTLQDFLKSLKTADAISFLKGIHLSYLVYSSVAE